MTGFGRGNAAGDNFSVAVEIKTVNNRFLDVHLRMGQELSALEVMIKRRIAARLSRGRVDVNIMFERSGESTYELDRTVIARYLTALRTIQKEFDLTGEPDITSLVRLPGAMQPMREELDDNMIAGVTLALENALEDLALMRASEAQALLVEMRMRIAKIEAEVPLIEAAAANLVDAYRARLQKRIGELLARSGQPVEIDPGRLAQEVAYLADKSDISEEIVRLRSHLDQFRETLDLPTEIGKRLDFLLQELNREANTVLSKSTDLNIKDAGLVIKAEIEKLREQVQNVE
ncbi:MAG: hypothetical protein QOE77_3762 [Blastocatellia bacterium]|nr:hypothetical protein [Blastocatellia bacterium]